MLPPLTAGSPSVLLAVERANRMPPMTGEIDGGQRMTGTEVRVGFEELWPPGEMNRLCQPRGVIERQRTLHLAMLVRALVISVGAPGGADQADILRAYLESEVPRVTRDRESEVDRLHGGCLGQSSRLQGLPQTATQTGAAPTISE